mgnify:CR=1 FL=1
MSMPADRMMIVPVHHHDAVEGREPRQQRRVELRFSVDDGIDHSFRFLGVEAELLKQSGLLQRVAAAQEKTPFTAQTAQQRPAADVVLCPAGHSDVLVDRDRLDRER